MEGIPMLIGIVITALMLVSVMPAVMNLTVSVAGNGTGIAGYGSGNVTNNAPVAAMVLLMPLVFVAIGVLLIIKNL